MRNGAELRWLRFTVGLVLLASLVVALATLPPPGAVLRHNTEQDIQATALFYMDLDRMPDLEDDLELRLDSPEAPD